MIAEKLIKAIRSIVGFGQVMLHEPEFCGSELAYLKDCIDSTFVSSVGKYVDRFEIEIANYAGAKHAVAVVNGTAALHVALKLAGVQTEDEVLMPALTFVATANAVSYCGSTPHFIESEEKTLGIDAYKLRNYLKQISEMRMGNCVNRLTGRVMRALVPMHTFGHPSDLEALLVIARDFNLVLVEDAAESLGSTYCGKHTGTFGLLGTLSFNGNKIVTAGGGGAILTNNSELARHAKHLTTTAKKPHRWEFVHDELGYNYRMPNLNAALACAQLEKLPAFLTAKRELFYHYKNAFNCFDGVKLFSEPENCRSNYWLQTIMLDDKSIACRDEVLQKLNDDGIMARPAWSLMSELPYFLNCPKMDLEVAQSLCRRIINLPSSSCLVKNKCM